MEGSMALRYRWMAAAASMTITVSAAAQGATVNETPAAPVATASYLYWIKPNFAGEPVRGDEPGIGQPVPGATPKELNAPLLWNMRAGLNVAADRKPGVCGKRGAVRVDVGGS